jgi:hypothetical protein
MVMAAAPTREIGTSGDALAREGLWSGQPSVSWSYLARDTLEHVPELQWRPGGRGMVRIYHEMRTDAQVQGLYLATTLPIRRYTFALNKNGAKAATLKRISRDYRIPVKGQEDKPLGRSKRRFKHRDHLRHALLAILYGHMYFNQVGEIGDDLKWHLRKLGPRMPATIMDILTQDDGGLKAIKQRARKTTGMWTTSGTVTIPVEELVAYIWEQEGGDWTGRSWLRGIYKNWLVKDRILRVGAINIQRAGGVPVIRAPKGANQKDMDNLAQMAQQFKIGEDSGGAIPHDAELLLAKAAGGDDAVSYIKLQNEEMGRGWLLMFMNLGQTESGSRALGGNFIDLAMSVQETIADWYCDVFSEHVIEDDVDWNEGESADAPLLGYTRTQDRQLAVADFVAMVDKKIILLSEEDEAWIREEYRMPKRDQNAQPRSVPDPSPSPAVEPGAATTRALHSPESVNASSPDDLGINKDILKQVVSDQLRELGMMSE